MSITETVKIPVNYYIHSGNNDDLFVSSFVQAYQSSDKWKDSVDSDCFIAGVFRINPYEIGRMSFTAHGEAQIRFTYYGLDTGSFYKYQTYSGKICLLGILPGTTPPTILLPAGTEDILLQKATAKIGSPVLEMGVELGELTETIQFLRSPLKSLREFLLKKNSRNLTHLCAIVRKMRKQGTGVNTGKLVLDSGITVADTWMELRYALRPLISSIMSIAEEVQRKKMAFFPERIKSTKCVFNKNEGINLRDDVGWIHPLMRAKRVIQGDTSVRCIAKVYYKRSRGPTTAESYGLALKFIPEIVWELTRASFVVDWIFSIGPWLGTCRIDPSINILGNTVSVKKVRNSVGRFEQPYMTNSNTCLLTGATHAVLDEMSYKREVDRNLANKPLFKGNEYLTLAKEIDLVTLILQPVMKGLRRELSKR